MGSLPSQEDPLEEEMANHSNILARIIPWTEELLSMGSQSWTKLSMLTHKLDVHPDKSFMSYVLCFVFIFIDFQSFNLGLPSPYSFLRWELNHFVSLFLSNVSVQSTQFPSTHYFCCISKFGYVMFSFSSN